ncbi:MAG: HNH endonuclease signature motif containing protein [Longimicrobiales bacterium]
MSPYPPFPSAGDCHLHLVREEAAPYDASDADVLESLGDEIATLAAHIHAATHRLLVLLAEFDQRRGWERDGQGSCAHWLAFRTGIDLGAAREKVRAARALTSLPLTGAAMARGELSFSQVRALTRVATAETEGDLVALARGCTTAQLERVVRASRRGSRWDEADADRERRERRVLSVFPDDDGMYAMRGVLPPEVGALLMRAIDAASDVLYRQDRASAASGAPTRTPAQRRADALALLVERAMEAGFGEDPCSGEAVSGTRAARYQVVLHVDTDTLAQHGGPARSELEDATRVSAETSRRVACDAALVRVTQRPDGSVLDIGRRTRTIPPALRRALEARDRGCRFPGCGSRFCDAHHVRHWGQGGETSLSNTVLLCSHHHTLVHEGGWTVRWDGDGRPVFLDSRGGEHYDARPAPPEIGIDPVRALVAEHARRGITPDWRTAGARWKREEDIPCRASAPSGQLACS